MKAFFLVLVSCSLLAYSLECPDIQPVSVGPDPGALIDVTIRGTVGVLLADTSSTHEANRYAAHFLKKNNKHWDPLIKLQSHYSDYQFQFRRYFSEAGSHLSLPDDSLFEINYLGPSRRQLWTTPGSNLTHDAIVQDYSIHVVIVTDYHSPCISDPAFCSVGGSITEYVEVPLDPVVFIQRTGKACLVESNYPPYSWDSDLPYSLYLSYCEADFVRPPDAEEWECLTCHCTPPYPELDCLEALDLKTGRVTLEATFTRLPYQSALANQWRYEPNGAPHLGANLIPIKKDMLIGYENYRYFAEDAIEVHEQCVGEPGWRKIIKYSSNAYNNGRHYMYLGPVNFHFPVNGTLPTFANHGMFINDPVHHHPHNIWYLNFTALDKKKQLTNGKSKIGFCAVGSKRFVNSEWAVWANNCTSCEYQCIPPGSADAYQTGIPCQHIDVTSGEVGKIRAKTKINAWDVMCEGQIVVNETTCEPLYEPTNLTACTLDESECYHPVHRPVCNHSSNELDYFDDNEEEVKYDHRGCGLSSVTDSVSQYGVDREIGPLRNTEFSLYGSQLRTCTNGTVTLNCTIPNSHSTQDNSEVVRVCESSFKLGCGTACRWEDALVTKVIPPGPTYTLVNFTCPSARDSDEPGGYYSLYRANFVATLGKHKDGTVVCTVV
mgnify:CR=1 FL=1